MQLGYLATPYPPIPNTPHPLPEKRNLYKNFIIFSTTLIELELTLIYSERMARRKSVITERQQTYVDTLMEGATKADAARSAGYKPSQTTVIERSATVKDALAEARAELEDLSTLRRVDVLNGLMEAIDVARVMAEPSSMIGGWREVAKIMGYYAPEVREVKFTAEQANAVKKLEVLTDAELLDMLQKRSMLFDVN